MRLAKLLVGAAAVAVPAVAGADMLAVGDHFPEWSLKDHTGVVVRSADLAGTTYLLWYYPKAMTSGCTAEGCALRDAFDGFTEAGVTILGVSFDDPEDNAKFVAKEHFPFRLLSDEDRKLAVAVGAADSPKRLWARRISYLVGPDGTVLKAYADVDPRTHAAQVLEDVRALAR